MQAFIILLAAVFTENMLLTRFLGMCSFLAVSQRLKTAIGLGAAVTFVSACTCPLNWIVYRWLLVPLQLQYLQYIAYIIVIAAFVQFVEMVIERFSPMLYFALGIFLPLITVNCAILGVSLFMTIREFTFVESFAYGLGGGAGWTLAIVSMAGIREKMKNARVPRGLEGPGITLIIAGIMALAFIGLQGMLTVE